MSSTRSLSLTRTVLRVLLVINPILGVAILVLLVASVLYEDWVFHALTHMPPDAIRAMASGLRVVMVIGIVAVIHHFQQHEINGIFIALHQLGIRFLISFYGLRDKLKIDLRFF